ncbi:hypothetical protein BC827DRAFT_549778 [Russula dissimulans]|nr:hypothetical protein BC827DRAFT_549778 [Russula dissimulans]
MRMHWHHEASAPSQLFPLLSTCPCPHFCLHELSLVRPFMSRVQLEPQATPSSNFQLIFNNALKAYEKRTKDDLLAHPLAAQLQACDSPTTILALLHRQARDFNQSRDGRLSRWLGPTVNVLYAFSKTLGEGVGLAFSPAKVVFAGVGVLLLAAKGVRQSQDALADIFERMERFFRRLEIYIQVPATTAMMDMIIQIMVEVLCVIGIATKEIKEARISE